MSSRLPRPSLVIALLLAAGLAAACDPPRIMRRDTGAGATDAASSDAAVPGFPDATVLAVDAGPPLDAGLSMDAGLPLDAALAPDAFVPMLDAFVPLDAFVARDAFVPLDAFVARDAFVPRDAAAAVDARVGTDAYSPMGPETFAFPTASDARLAAADLYFWRAGDYVEGSRTAVAPSITSFSMSLVLELNGLSCDTQDVRVRINGTEVGTFSIAGGDTTITRSFSFAPIAGPTYTLRYETISEVASGCGAAGYSNTGSSVTLR